jgi:hypothetical protein
MVGFLVRVRFFPKIYKILSFFNWYQKILIF